MQLLVQLVILLILKELQLARILQKQRIRLTMLRMLRQPVPASGKNLYYPEQGS